MTDIPIPPTLGLVLLGGQARRMGGGDKARIEISGVSILDRVLANLSGQCTGIVINANGDPERFADTGLTVLPDAVPDYAGPLAGILAGLDWLATQKNGIEWLLSVPGDCPFLPDDLVERLHQARRERGAGVGVACARSGGWRQPVVGLWSLALREILRQALVEEGLRKIDKLMERHGVAFADWPDQPFDPFFNINAPEDVERAQRIASQHY